MRVIVALVLSLALIGCATTKPPTVEPTIIVKQKLIPLTIPTEMFALPAYPETVDPKRMTDKDLAIWLIENEKRNQEIEKRLGAIRAYQEQRLKDLTPLIKAD